MTKYKITKLLDNGKSEVKIVSTLKEVANAREELLEMSYSHIYEKGIFISHYFDEHGEVVGSIVEQADELGKGFNKRTQSLYKKALKTLKELRDLYLKTSYLLEENGYKEDSHIVNDEYFELTNLVKELEDMKDREHYLD